MFRYSTPRSTKQQEILAPLHEQVANLFKSSLKDHPRQGNAPPTPSRLWHVCKEIVRDDRRMTIGEVTEDTAIYQSVLAIKSKLKICT